MPDKAFPYWFPVATLLLGFLTKSLLDWLQHRWTVEREREARDAARREQLFERRTTFQRQTLLDLQEAVFNLLRSTGAMHIQDLMAHRSTGKWQKQLFSEGLSDGHRVLQARTSLLRVRVRDDDVRELVSRFKTHSTEVSMSRSLEDSEAAMTMMVEVSDALNERVGKLLRQMDDDDSGRS